MTRMAGPRRIATKTERETVTTNVPLAITERRREEKQGCRQGREVGSSHGRRSRHAGLSGCHCDGRRWEAAMGSGVGMGVSGGGDLGEVGAGVSTTRQSRMESSLLFKMLWAWENMV